ncbi:RDPA-like protein [Mya arenaria]|uniref:RDPA-like protein n=1 Tax=Mya arenaria TaxID=6604 RepID=A0ABY7FQD5_MYAAR|nr:RDPA-like protein [Mya arenaria]
MLRLIKMRTCFLRKFKTSTESRLFSSVFDVHNLALSVCLTMDVKPAQLGVEIRGVDLNESISEELIKKIKSEVHVQRLLIFKNQNPISGKRQVEISKWFGDLESTFYKHPKSPHPDVFRVSNVAEEGCTNVGRTGWHIDGSFMAKPFGFSLYYMTSVPRNGNTELIESLSEERRARFERLWMLPDRRDRLTHPLIYPHPATGQPTLCFHLGMTERFVWDYGTPQQRVTDRSETAEIIQEIHNEIVKDDRKLWEEGDFIISDNLAVGHEASPETQLPREKVGLRVLHRTTIKGTNVPSKPGVVAEGSSDEDR